MTKKNMKITIDIDKLYKNNLSATDYVFLWLLSNDREDCITKVALPDVKELEKDGWLKITMKDEKLSFVIKKKFFKLIEQELDKSNVENWIDDWLNLFPKGVKSGGYPVKGDKKNCLLKMKKFIVDHPGVNKEKIFDATKAYLDVKRKDNWAYTKLAKYFIEHKDDGSMLASYCEYIDDRMDQKEESSTGKTYL